MSTCKGNQHIFRGWLHLLWKNSKCHTEFWHCEQSTSLSDLPSFWYLHFVILSFESVICFFTFFEQHRTLGWELVFDTVCYFANNSRRLTELITILTYSKDEDFSDFQSIRARTVDSHVSNLSVYIVNPLSPAVAVFLSVPDALPTGGL